MKLIIEKYPDGSLYAYIEDDEHFERVENCRRNRLPVSTLANECSLDSMEPGHLVFNLKKKQA